MVFYRFIGILFFVALTGCTMASRIVNAYKIDIQQGNIVTQEMLAQLRPGLTRDQTRFILGSPLLADMFHANRWDYIYRLKTGNTGEVSTRQVSIFFDASGNLERVTGDIDNPLLSGASVTLPENRNREIDLGSIAPQPAATATKPAAENTSREFSDWLDSLSGIF